MDSIRISNWIFVINQHARTQRIAEDEKYKIYLWGGYFWYHNEEIIVDILKVARAVVEGHASFDDIHGYYKVIVQDKEAELIWFWEDNQGTQSFFIDTEENRISDSFLTLRNNRTHLIPNKSAIAQLFAADYILSDDTIVNGIKVTSWNKCYHCDNTGIHVEDKGLSSFSENKGEDLHVIISGLLKAFPEKKMAVCTGGTDSRTVLAHLISLGEQPPLIITGHTNNPDLAPAKAIAETTGLHLDIVDPLSHEEGWIEEGYVFCDGVFDPVNAYRQMRKSKIVEEKICLSEWGGVGGEYYKNYYCPWRYWRKKDWKSEIRNLFKDLTRQYSWMGESLRSEKETINRTIESLLESIDESNILCGFNAAGFQIMVKKASSITNGYSNHVVKIDPLFERSVIAKASRVHPMKHSMAVWQRREIHNYQPSLSDLKTDTGYTCSVNQIRLTFERIKKFKSRIDRKIALLKKKLHMSYIDYEQKFWNDDYADARGTELFSQAVEICRKLDIISSDIDIASVPLKHTGNILLVGMTFEKFN